MINLSLNPYDSVAREALRALLDVYDRADNKSAEKVAEPVADEPTVQVAEPVVTEAEPLKQEVEPEQPETAGDQNEAVTREPGDDVETAEQQFVSKSEFETAYRAIYQKDPAIGKWVKDKLTAVRAARVSDLDDEQRTVLYRELCDRYDPVPF